MAAVVVRKVLKIDANERKFRGVNRRIGGAEKYLSRLRVSKRGTLLASIV